MNEKKKKIMKLSIPQILEQQQKTWEYCAEKTEARYEIISRK